MFIQLQSNRLLNLCWLDDCLQDKLQSNLVVIYLVNGSEIIEKYDNSEEALQRVQEIHTIMEKFTLGIK